METDYLNARTGQYAAYTRRLEARWLSRLFGFPIYTRDHDGVVRKVRAKRLPCGDILTRRITGYVIGYANGTFHPGSYLVRWWHRETWLG